MHSSFELRKHILHSPKTNAKSWLSFSSKWAKIYAEQKTFLNINKSKFWEGKGSGEAGGHYTVQVCAVNETENEAVAVAVAVAHASAVAAESCIQQVWVQKFNYINKSRALQRAKRNETQRNATPAPGEGSCLDGKTAGKLVAASEGARVKVVAPWDGYVTRAFVSAAPRRRHCIFHTMWQRWQKVSCLAGPAQCRMK